jgi:predicted alpha/beta-fold hydrolase
MTGAAQTLGLGFEPPRLLRHAHLQSVLASAGLRNRGLRRAAAAMLAASTDVVLDLDGVRLLGHYSPGARLSPDPAAAKLLIVLHGWEGSADSHYVVALSGRAHAAGFDVFRLNFRDHGGTAMLNEGLFHSCRLEEVVSAVGAIAARYSATKRYLVGFSLGGNFALRVAASPAVEALLTKVVGVCPVLRPASTMLALERGLWIYRDYFLRRWRRSLAAKAAAFPELYDFGDLRRFRTLTETTEFFVERHTGFADLDSYLKGYTLTGDVLAGLAVPAWLLAAADDPVIPSKDLERLARSEALEVTLSPWGGHCGFLENFRLESWLDRRVLAALG